MVFVDVAISSFEGLSIDRVPVEEKVDDWTVIFAQVVKELGKHADCKAVVLEPRSEKVKG